MKSVVFGLGWLLFLVSSGCTITNAVKTPVSVLDRFTNLPPTDTVGAYPTWRYIGIKIDPEAPCPEIDGWQVRQLFQLGVRHSCGEADSAGTEAVEKQMDGLCRYESNGARPKPLPPLVTLGLSRLEPDAVALAPALQIPGASGPLGRKIAPLLATYFTSHVGGGGAGPDDTNEPVRLAFLDSEPTAEGIVLRRGNSGHGHFLRLIGGDLGGSAVAITTRLALAVNEFNATDPERSSRPSNGGSVGSFTDLAEAIHQEVTAWENENRSKDKEHRRHLVINLSVGWDGKKFGGYDETRVCDLPAGPRAVYLALVYAARQGVLIFAAAGNSQAGPHASSGPLLPAAWARGNIQGSGSICGGEDLKGPLLYAVGGVQWNGKPLTNARKGGMPELAAFGDHVVLKDLTGEPTSAYTGSSVATAVVSSIAARLWHENPDKDAGGIAADLLNRGGIDLKYPADFAYRKSPPPNVREISLRSVFGGQTSKEPRPPKLSDLFEETEASITLRLPAAAPKACSKGSGVTCPGRLYDDYWSQPWVLPQPEDDPCPNCAMGPPRRAVTQVATDPGPPKDLILRVEISADWKSQNATLESGTLDVELEGGSHKLYELKLPHSLSEPWSVRLPATDFATTPPVRAVLTWLVEKPNKEKASINSPILVFD